MTKPIEIWHGPKPTNEGTNEKWWNAGPANAHTNITQLVNWLEQDQSYRHTMNLRYARLYANTELRGFSSVNYFRTLANANTNNRLSYNVVKSCVDTAASKIAKNKPKPLFLTEDGDFNLKHKAQLLTKYMEGMFEEMDMYTEGQKVFTDACVFGTGAMKIYIDPSDSKIKCERILIDELIVDDTEGKYGKPRQMFQVKTISKDVLKGMFPQFKEQIQSAQPISGSTTTVSDQVLVTESWHLPSETPKTNKKGKITETDGRHSITIDNCTLVYEDYTKDHFPFVFVRWSDKLTGFWGMGIAEELIGIQLEISMTMRNISKAISLVAVPRVLIDTSVSNIVTANITNEIGNVIKYNGGSPPQFNTPQAMTGEVYQYLETLKADAYKVTGISQMSASSQKPAGLDSGVALREFQDIESERFMLVGQRYEKAYMEAARQIIELSKELYEKSKDNKDIEAPKVKIRKSKFLKQIAWKDVDMDEDQFQMDVFPINFLPSTPAGKLQTIQELIQAGMIPKDQAIGLLDFPDLDKFLSLQTADQDNTEKMLGIITEEGRYVSPEPFMNLALAQTLAQQTYLKAKCDNLDEERLELLRTFMSDIQTLLNPPPPTVDPMDQPLPPPPMDPAMGGPVGSPVAPPVSDLLPMQGGALPPSGLPQG